MDNICYFIKIIVYSVVFLLSRVLPGFAIVPRVLALLNGIKELPKPRWHLPSRFWCDDRAHIPFLHQTPALWVKAIIFYGLGQYVPRIRSCAAFFLRQRSIMPNRMLCGDSMQKYIVVHPPKQRIYDHRWAWRCTPKENSLPVSESTC